MSKAVKAGLLVTALASGLGLVSVSTFGTMEIAKKEKQPCTTCHVKLGSKELNEVGKCYAKERSLKKCEPKAAHKK